MPKAVVISPPAPPSQPANLGKTVNTSKAVASKADVRMAPHRSPATMMAHMRKTCNGGKC